MGDFSRQDKLSHNCRKTMHMEQWIEVSLYINKKLVTPVQLSHEPLAQNNWTVTLNTYSKSEHLSYLI
jgi:hypothetical protein